MYRLIRSAGSRRELLAELPSLVISLVIAEAFYKFHSFTLECGAFLLTWFAVSYLCSQAWGALTVRRPSS